MQTQQTPDSSQTPSIKPPPIPITHPGQNFLLNHKLAFISIPLLILCTFIISFYYFYQKNQTGTVGRAANPSPTPNFIKDFGSLNTNSTVNPHEQEVLKNPVVKFTVTGQNGSFLPDRLKTYQGQIVNIAIEAIDKSYDFTIPQLNLSLTVSKGSRKILEFQATSAGKYTYLCSINCPTSNQNKGVIEVE